MIVKQNFLQFLNCTPSQKEVSLIIAQDVTELQEFQEIISTQGYRQAVDVSEIIKRTQQEDAKVYFVIRHLLPKELYDFIVQYPTGQIELFDKEIMRKTILTPKYRSSAVVFLLTKKTLTELQAKGMQLTDVVGLAYQN